MRKRHTKSRNGCRECKQRKLKCDEVRPACGRCVASTRHCSYLGLKSPPSHPPTSELSTQLSLSALSEAGSAPSISSAPAEEAGDSIISPAAFASTLCQPPATLAERYSLFHLEMLFHVKERLSADMFPMQPQLDGFLDLVLREALTTSYLMDEMLAFAAAHKGTIASDGNMYRLEAIRLQNRALEQFNSGQVEVTDENCITVFAFSTLLGQHTLFDTFSSATELCAVLDKLVNCINIHQGIGTVVAQSSEKIRNLFQEETGANRVHMSAEVPAVSGGKCDDLLRRLGDSNDSLHARPHYEKTVHILNYLFDISQPSEERCLVACQEWLVRVPREFVLLLAQRRPEALVIIAYYGVLLHRAKDYWIVGDAGHFLIKSISRHLGTYWADWLVFPVQVLEQSHEGAV
ncbi:hypothetical protein QWA68_015142 [Fusarium oxysporum]|nr:hypothetical protein QWA68_015142 [Fusarium oxysporum]